MTGKPDLAIAAIGDARAFLAAFLSGGWRELHVASGTCEIFIALTGAGPNPMRALAPMVQPPREGRQIIVKAPHVATLLSVAPDGSRVPQGGIVATLSVLEEEIPLIAESNCVVERTEAAIGALLEFDQDILCLRELE